MNTTYTELQANRSDSQYLKTTNGNHILGVDTAKINCDLSKTT